jgi:pimeloyl-ACP methyl ester carboxylesterase
MATPMPRLAGTPRGALRYVERGVGPPLVLVHGSYGSLNHWSANLDGLAERFRVLALDLPGFGGSYAIPQGSGLDAFADALADFLDAQDLDRAALGGFSFGALACIRLATTAPQRVTATFVVSPPVPGPPSPRIAAIQQRIATLATTKSIRLSAETMLRDIMLFQHDKVTDEVVAMAVDNILNTKFRARPLLYESDIYAMLAGLESPVLLMHGEQDPFYQDNPELSRHRFRPGRSRRLDVVPGAAHWACFDAPDRVNAAALAFLEAQG